MIDFKKEIKELKKSNLYRENRVVEFFDDCFIKINGKRFINYGSNNYLSMNARTNVLDAYHKGIQQWGTGAGASRLITGNLKIHEDLQERLAFFSKKEAALVFSSGYMANCGLISALADKNSWVILDKINHASIIDGARLSQANIRVYPHLNMNYLEKILKSIPQKSRKIIITDSIFSMDGDCAPLKEIALLKKKYNAMLVVDEAHAVGIYGEDGSGLSDELNVIDDVDFKIGTLSKSFCLQGGYIASSKDAIDYLRNKARSYIYTTGITPPVCEAAIEVLKEFRTMKKSRRELREKSDFLRTELYSSGFDTGMSSSQIIPIMIGDVNKTLNIQNQFMNNGHFVPAIRYPTVKKGTERLRVSLNLSHSKKDLLKLIDLLKNFK